MHSTPRNYAKYRALVAGVSAVLLAGCMFSAENANGEMDSDSGVGAAGGPGASATFSLGRPAPDSLIVRMNHDVSSSGDELPPGSGTVAEGLAIYATQCASCHGVNGEGIAPTFPRLLGRNPATDSFNFANDPALPHTIGNYWPYATTLFDYTKRAMPFLTPGSLTDNQVYALVAYLLAKEQIVADTATMNRETLRAVRMPFQDRFVPDNRRPNGSR